MKELHLALIGGPQYDGLLDLLPAFEAQTGYKLVVDVRLPHGELNERLAGGYCWRPHPGAAEYL